jgi:hypothetical protein
MTLELGQLFQGAPIIISNGGGLTARLSVVENSIATTVDVDVNPEATGVTYSIVGGADAAKFSINATGVLSFISAPDFEVPTDVGADNTYEVEVVAGNILGDDRQLITVNVTNLVGITQTANTTPLNGEGEGGSLTGGAAAQTWHSDSTAAFLRQVTNSFVDPTTSRPAAGKRSSHTRSAN